MRPVPFLSELARRRTLSDSAARPKQASELLLPVENWLERAEFLATAAKKDPSADTSSFGAGISILLPDMVPVLATYRG